MNLVLISEHQSDPKKARIGLERLLLHHPNHPQAMKKYGLLLSQSPLDLESKSWLEKAIRANPQDTRCILALGSTYERNERYDDAIHLYQNVGEDQPRLRRVTDTKIARLRALLESKSGCLVRDLNQASIETASYSLFAEIALDTDDLDTDGVFITQTIIKRNAR